MQNKTNVLNSKHYSRKNFLSLLLFFLFFSLGFSQVKTIKGNILLSENLRGADNVYVHNVNTNNYSITDITGGFEIKASIGDTLRFFGEFLKERQIVITQEHFNNKKLYVTMNNEVIELDELVANPFLTGNLGADLDKIEYIDTISVLYSNLGLDIKNRDIVPREKKQSVIPKIGKIPIPTSLNVEALYKLMTGYYKKQERLYDYESLDKITKGLLDKIPEEYYLKALKIPKEEIFNFAFFAAQTDKLLFTSLLQNDNYTEIKVLLEKKSKIYLERLNANEKDSQSYNPN